MGHHRWGERTYAQHGDDLFLVNAFELMGIDKPSYLDIGAHDPVEISNTALLYERGSTGVNVEANPNLIKEFLIKRPKDININIGVGPEPGVLPFYMYYPKAGRNTFCKEEVDKQLKSEPMHKINEVREINVITINELVSKFCPNSCYPDLLSIDIEGLDYDVLKSADLSKTSPKIICVEVRHDETVKFKLLLADRYRCAVRLGENLIFIRDDVLGHIVP